MVMNFKNEIGQPQMGVEPSAVIPLHLQLALLPVASLDYLSHLAMESVDNGFYIKPEKTTMAVSDRIYNSIKTLCCYLVR